MKVNKKQWRLLLVDGSLHFAVKAGSWNTACTYITNHLPRKAIISALKASCTDWYDAMNILYLRTKNLKKLGDEYVLELKW